MIWKNLITLLTPIMLIQVALTLSWSLFPINTMEQPESHCFQVFGCHVVQVERWSLCVSVAGVLQDHKAADASHLFPAECWWVTPKLH